MGKKYSELSKQQKKNNMKAVIKYQKKTATRLSIVYANTDFETVQDYINACGANSYNSFVKECVKYAIDNDFKGIRNGNKSIDWICDFVT